MSALTMTLLPEPVAPAMSRCGIFARSTAWALPATSRPSANVSVEPDALKSTSSRIRRRATMLKSLFGISIPTALLPGIGASIRRVRAASAIARSSDEPLDPADLDVRRRLDLVLGDDRAGVAADDLGRDPEAGELLDDDLLVPRVGGLVAAGHDRDGDVVEHRERREDVGDPLTGRWRVGAVGDVVRVAHRLDGRGCDERGARGRAGRSRGREGRRVRASGRDSGRDRACRRRPRHRSGRVTDRPGSPSRRDRGLRPRRPRKRKPTPARASRARPAFLGRSQPAGRPGARRRSPWRPRAGPRTTPAAAGRARAPVPRPRRAAGPRTCRGR